jgi:hypothetical protein
MKRCKLVVLVLGIAVLATVKASATSITGSIQFGGTSSVTSSLSSIGAGYNSWGSAGTDPVVLGGTQTGSYSGVNAGTSATWSPFSFNPPAAFVTPLWNMFVEGRNYNFSATSINVLWTDGTLANLVGTGIAHITGYDDTDGSWTATATSQGCLSFSFVATPAPGSDGSVPDGGTTALLLGAGLTGLALLRRKLA